MRVFCAVGFSVDARTRKRSSREMGAGRFRPPPLFILNDHRQKVFIACDNGVVTFAVLVFHVPDVPRADVPERAVAGGHPH